MDARVTELMTRWLVPVLVPAGTPLSTPLNAHLAVALIVDAPAGPRALQQLQLDRWGMELEQLLPLALDNLRRAAGADPWKVVAPDTGARALVAAEGQVAARLLVVDDLLGGPLGGSLVAVPTTDALIVQPLEKVSSLDRLTELITATLHLAGQGAAPPLLPNQLLWTDGQVFEVLELQEEEDSYTLVPGPNLARALKRLASHWHSGTVYAA